ncbi:hypothetical protein IKU74_08215 [bacterium]|nr:hypothetical protein [bacterium]
MTIIGRLVYKATGIMSKKGIMKNCKEIGTTLADEIKLSGGKIEHKRIHELLTERIGKKKATNIIISEDLDTFKKVSTENLKISDELAEHYFNNTKSIVVPNLRTKETLLCLRTNTMNNTDALNATGHELEHVLYNNVSLFAKFKNIILKYAPKAIFEEVLKETSELLNKNGLLLQQHLITFSKLGADALSGNTKYKAGLQGLLNQTETKDREQLHQKISTIIRDKILPDYKTKDKLTILNGLKRLLKDESRAYKVGGAIQRYVEPSETLSKSEMLAQLYNEAITVIKQEIKIQEKAQKLESLTSK